MYSEEQKVICVPFLRSCRCGFAQSQEAYDKAAEGLFRTLEMLEDHLGGSRYLCGDVLTLADVCLFTTLIRFDVVYNVLFKCTKKKIIEFTNLHAYLRDIYQVLKFHSLYVQRERPFERGAPNTVIVLPKNYLSKTKYVII